jgi:RNA recognition motif-containing protein
VRTSQFLSPVFPFEFTNLCRRYGRIADAFVPSDRENPGRNRGFGFVTFEDAAAAQVIARASALLRLLLHFSQAFSRAFVLLTLDQAAMDGANGMDIDGRNIRVAFASEKPQGSFAENGPRAFSPRVSRFF